MNTKDSKYKTTIMDKHIYLNESDTISRDIVKLAISLPESNIGLRAKKELVNSAMQTSSHFKVACLEDAGKESVEKFNLVLEKAGISKFWLEFLRDEGIAPGKSLNDLIDRLSDLISHTIHIRKDEEQSTAKLASFAGEWLLDD